ncbi:MAG: antibiotic biosynthesis monooxygenase [Actinomycetes bacterium]
MVGRMWRGSVRREQGDAYAAYMSETGLRGYASTPGNLGAYMLRRDVEEHSEFVMVSLWESMDAVHAFAGDDPEIAVFYPEDDAFLVDRDLHATHWTVTDAASVAGP